MNPRERLIAAIEGRPVDRVPYTAWHHFYLTPAAGPGSPMAQAELDFYDRFQPDLLKVMHDVLYESGPSIESPDDWTQLPVLDPRQGNFGAQLFTLRQIRRTLDAAVPMIDTVFNVYHYANKISCGRLLRDLRQDPQKVHVGLRAIAESLCAYARATIVDGCEGIYFALDGASADGATREEYCEHFLPYDRTVLASVAKSRINIMHLHGYRDLYFDIAEELPASVVCWSDRAAGPSLADARAVHAGCLMGGLDETRFGRMSVAEIAEQAADAIDQTGGRGFILAPGCSVPLDTAPERLAAIRQAVA